MKLVGGLLGGDWGEGLVEEQSEVLAGGHGWCDRQDGFYYT